MSEVEELGAENVNPGRIHDAACSAESRYNAEFWTNTKFVDGFRMMQAAVHLTAKQKGWWDQDRNEGEMIALMHSELSEALEGLRHGDPPDSHVPEFSSVEVEFADTIIRMMDYAEAKGMRLAEALVAKRMYNLQRERMHGGKKF